MLTTQSPAASLKANRLKLWPVVGWLLFFGIFLFFMIPKAAFFSAGFPPYIGFENNFQRGAFVIHILAGIIVYITGIIQFTPAVRNRYISFHRKIGKLYILASLLCVFGLYILLPIFSADIFWMEVSHYSNGTLWLLFVILAYVFIRRKNIIFHRRFMISSFICATYFVVIRIVDHTAMPFFRSVTSDEAGAMAVSDFSVWVIPLSFIWMYWFIADRRKNTKLPKIKK
jgi:uncharacterized membrane protein YozB (DUF420 family)